jgi:ADP-L-glycero-D-manno-heptose 6-epimerase
VGTGKPLPLQHVFGFSIIMQDLIIVTGAAGFIGRNTVAELNRRGYENLMLVDLLGDGEKWHNLSGLIFNDLLSPAEFLALVTEGSAPRARAVIHLGACSATTEKDADYLLRNNYRYTRTLAEWCVREEIRFVYASSAATYGAGELGYSDADEVTRQLKPLNMYGYSKHLFDLWALRHGLLGRIAGLKYFNVYGPYEDHKGEMRSVVHKAYNQLLAEGRVQLFQSYRPDYRDGEQKRDFVYVRDAVNVTLYLMEHPEVGGLFNCGTGQARTWLDLAHALFAAMGRTPQIEFMPMPEILQGKYQYFTQAETSKLRNSGYNESPTSLEDGVRDYVQYLAQQS